MAHLDYIVIIDHSLQPVVVSQRRSRANATITVICSMEDQAERSPDSNPLAKIKSAISVWPAIGVTASAIVAVFMAVDVGVGVSLGVGVIVAV